MKILISTAIAVASFLSIDSAWALKVGDQMPELKAELVNIDGKNLTLSSAKGTQGSLVFFTCNHCPYARAWEARYTKFGNDLMKKGFGVIAINSNDSTKVKEDSLPAMVERAQTLKMKFPYVVDQTSDVARAFGAERTPEFFLFDKTGKLIYTGAFDDNAEEPGKVRNQYLAKAVRDYQKNRAVQVAETRSVGCSIKFRN